MKNIPLLVYGSLRKGMYNHGLLEGAEYKGVKLIKGYALYDSGFGYPYAVKEDGSIMATELYLVDSETFYRIAYMEMAAGYYCAEYDEGAIRAYLWEWKRPVAHLAPAGLSWVKYVNNQRKEIAP